jgi:two-component system sensor histidine kinase KdpD
MQITQPTGRLAVAVSMGDNGFVPVLFRNIRRSWRQCRRAVVSVLAIAVVTFCSYTLHFNAATVELLYLLIIVWQSLAGGFVLSAAVSLAAGACLDYFFLPPLLSLEIADPLNVLAFAVFLVIALVITRLVSRLRSEADRARSRGAGLEQLFQVARQLLLVEPDRVNSTTVLRTFREGFAANAVCLFDGATADLQMEGTSQYDLPQRTRQTYISGEDADNRAAGVVIRCLRAGSAVIGAVGFEGLPDPDWTAGPLSVLAAAALEQARAFRKASDDTAAAQVEVFRTAILDALAHEFKTPLATILAVVGGLRESPRLGADEVELAAMIESEAARLSSLTSRLLRMAGLDRREVKPRMRNTDITALVRRVAHRYAAQSPERQVSVSCQGQPGEAPADRELLDLALTQLLDNAFKYSIPGSSVTIETGAEEGFITARVRNEGSSIAPYEQDRIFERFYRGNDVRKLVSGAGLGLYVARKIAVAHGGSLDLDKSASPGAVVFCLKLPALNNGSSHVPGNS